MVFIVGCIEGLIAGAIIRYTDIAWRPGRYAQMSAREHGPGMIVGLVLALVVSALFENIFDLNSANRGYSIIIGVAAGYVIVDEVFITLRKRREDKDNAG